jgi:hypothetical protein
MSKNIKIKADKYPIIEIITTGITEEAEIPIFQDELEHEISTRTGDFIIISDPGSEFFMSVKTRISLGKALNYISHKYRNRELAVFVVIISALSRMMMSCIALVARDNNITVVSGYQEAVHKAEALLANKV